MILEVQKGNAEIIGKAVALLRGKVPEGKIARAETFTRQYYSRVEADDLAERNLSDLCRIVVSIIFACDRGFEPKVARHIQVLPVCCPSRHRIVGQDHWVIKLHPALLLKIAKCQGD